METINRVDHEFFASFQLATLLKEIGYNYKCPRIYCFEEGTYWMDAPASDWNSEFLSKEYKCISMPRLFDVQTWLREEKNIVITIYLCFDHTKYGSEVHDLDNAVDFDCSLHYNASDSCSLSLSDTYEGALGQAILFAATLIKNHNECK